jgi:hypothetical protein
VLLSQRGDQHGGKQGGRGGTVIVVAASGGSGSRRAVRQRRRRVALAATRYPLPAVRWIGSECGFGGPAHRMLEQHTRQSLRLRRRTGTRSS